MEKNKELEKFKKLGEAKYYNSLKTRYPQLNKKQIKYVINNLKRIDKEIK